MLTTDVSSSMKPEKESATDSLDVCTVSHSPSDGGVGSPLPESSERRHQRCMSPNVKVARSKGVNGMSYHLRPHGKMPHISGSLTCTKTLTTSVVGGLTRQRSKPATKPLFMVMYSSGSRRRMSRGALMERPARTFGIMLSCT